MGALSALGRGTDLKGNRFTGLLDMIDGGGGGKSGDRFEGGGLLSMLGNLFAKPYEAQQRVEDIAARAATRNVKSQPNMTTGTPITEYSDSLLAPIVNQDVYGIGDAGEYGGTPSVTPDVYNIGSAGEFGGAMAADNLSQSDVLTGGTVQPMPVSSQDANFSGGGLLGSPDLPIREGLPLPRDAEGILAPELPASERNTELVSFNRRMETVPEMLRGSEIESIYRDYLLNGGLATFAQFTNQSMATYDPAVTRSPAPPALAEPNAIVPPTVPVTPEAAGLGMSDADQMVAIRSAIMRDPKMIGELEEAFGVDMVREALAGLRMVGGSPIVPKAPLTSRDQRGLLPTMPITRFN